MGDLTNEILTKLRTSGVLQFVTIWNNQFELLEDGDSVLFPMPCAFLELKTDDLNEIGGGYQGSDVGIVIHIGQNMFNGNNIDENTTIFTLRDDIIRLLAGFKPTTAGTLVKIREEQDFTHSNVYRYTIEYKTHWIDNTCAETPIYTTITDIIATNLLNNQPK